MCTARALLVVGVFVVASACSRRGISGDDDAGGAGSATAVDSATMEGPGASETGASQETGATTGDATATTAPPLECEDPYVACDDECTVLSADYANCGECGYACKGVGTSKKCRNSQCEPGVWPCVKPEQGVATCTQACASVGQTCAVDADCAGYVRVWMTTSANDNNPEATIEKCERLFDGNTSFTQGCDEPIDWEHTSSGKTVLGVACCCTQD
jgi:hypothetical protein